MNFDKEKICVFGSLLEKANDIVLVGHFNPDGDAVGSTLGLYHFLSDMGKKVCVIYPNEYPIVMEPYFEGVDYLIFSNGEKLVRKRLNEAELLICLDFSRYSRTCEILEDYLRDMDCEKIVIDHHEEPDQIGLLFSDVRASSTCELVYKILSEYNENGIGLKCASSLYIGICTDTGSFSHSCSRSDVFEVVARLVDKGVDIASIKRQVMDLSTENRLRLLGYLLNEKMKVFPDKGAAYIAVSKKELRNFDFKKGDLEGVVNYILRMDGIRFAALLSERQDKIRMSFRSLSPKVDVNKFAAKYWEGGGHVQAAGGTSSFGLELTCVFLEQQIEKCLYDKV